MPFAVPLHRGLRVGEGLGGVVDLQRRAVAAELARVELRERLVHFQDRIDGALDHAGHVADDVGHGHQVLVVDAFLGRGLLDVHQFAQRHERRGAGGAGLGQRVGVAGADAQREQFLGRRARGSAAVRSMMFTSSFSRGRCSRSTDSPPTAMRSVCEIVSALMPCSAAFSLSMTKRAFGWSASTYQSMSTTPGVLLKMSRTLRASAWRSASVGP